jgi:hypothetical protein
MTSGRINFDGGDEIAADPSLVKDGADGTPF